MSINELYCQFEILGNLNISNVQRLEGVGKSNSKRRKIFYDFLKDVKSGIFIIHPCFYF